MPVIVHKYSIIIYHGICQNGHWKRCRWWTEYNTKEVQNEIMICAIQSGKVMA